MLTIYILITENTNFLCLNRFYKQYGDIVCLRGIFGRNPIVMLFNPEEIEKVCIYTYTKTDYGYTFKMYSFHTPYYFLFMDHLSTLIHFRVVLLDLMLM